MGKTYKDRREEFRGRADPKEAAKMNRRKEEKAERKAAKKEQEKA